MKQGSGFVNLNRYLQANKNSKVGQAVQSGVQSNVNNFQSGLSSAQNQFKSGVQSNALGTEADKALREEVLSKIGTLSSKDQVAGVGDNSGSKVITDDHINKFGVFNAGAYKGPNDIENSSKFLNQSQNLNALGQAAKSQGGRQGLLQQFVGGNQYTQGQQKLDSLLFGQQGNRLGAINRSVQGLAQNTANQVGLARDQAKLQASQNATFGQETQKLVNDPLQAHFTQLDGSNPDSLVSKYRNDQKTAYEAAVAAAGGLDSNNAFFQGYKGQTTWGIDPRSYLSQSFEANASNVITPEQQAQMTALSKLAGKDLSAIPTLSQDHYDPTKAVSFDKAAYDSAVEGKNRHFHDVVLAAPENVMYEPTAGRTLQLPAAIDYYRQQAAKYGDLGQGPYYNSLYSFYGQTNKFR
jgi:hypothetical protein